MNNVENALVPEFVIDALERSIGALNRANQDVYVNHLLCGEYAAELCNRKNATKRENAIELIAEVYQCAVEHGKETVIAIDQIVSKLAMAEGQAIAADQNRFRQRPGFQARANGE